MSCHEVAFAHGTCRVEIDNQPTIDGVPSFVAHMWLVDDAGLTSALIMEDGAPAEIHGLTQALALSSAVTYLASRLGPLSEYAHRCAERDDVRAANSVS